MSERYWEARYRDEFKRAERLRLELEKIAWMDEFLDADSAKAMMGIAREAVRTDEESLPPRATPDTSLTNGER